MEHVAHLWKPKQGAEPASQPLVRVPAHGREVCEEFGVLQAAGAGVRRGYARNHVAQMMQERHLEREGGDPKYVGVDL